MILEALLDTERNKMRGHSEYLRNLNHKSSKKPIMPFVKDGVLTTADGYRLLVETSPILPALVKIGDLVKTSYDTGGVVLKIRKYTTCSCPMRYVSGDKFCEESWESEATQKYHIEVVNWTILYCSEDNLKVGKNEVLSCDIKRVCLLNGFVAFGGRIMHFFENNRTEVFIEKRKLDLVYQKELF